MLPNQLRADQFSRYPPEARELAVRNIDTLRQLPLLFLPLFLRELIAYDWKFPAERKEVNAQLNYMAGLSPEQLTRLMARFAVLRISTELEAMNWVDAPREFSEQLTTYLWATHQIDSFRQAALEFGKTMDAAMQPETPPTSRLTIVLIGKGVVQNKYPLFRKLRPYGVYFSRVDPVHGTQILLECVAGRAQSHPLPFGHWYIDGGRMEAFDTRGVTCVSYNALDPVRNAVIATMRKALNTGTGPEALRTKLAQLEPGDLGMDASHDDPVLRRFQISVLTEGSGTQLYSTTFAQWATREALRRAQPVTLLLRFAPRQRERPMNELLAQTNAKAELDPEGSLIDADMGAYYTWINQQRLSGADRACFLAWFEGGNEALAIGPAMPHGTQSKSPLNMTQLLQTLL